MTRPRMTRAQQIILEHANPTTREIPSNMVDGRSMHRLAREGWAIRVPITKRGRRVRPRWDITEAGIAAARDAEIITQPERPWWRHWTVNRISPRDYLVDGHLIVRPGTMWRITCPASAEPVAYAEHLAEAADKLAEHFAAVTDHQPPTDPDTAPAPAVGPVDLDQPDPAPSTDTTVSDTTVYADYGWIVTRDHTYDLDPEFHQRIDFPSRVGYIGPRNIHPEVQKALEAGKVGKRWRTRHDDPGMTLNQSLVHAGRFVTLADVGLAGEDDIDPECEFGPLTDLSEPDCGAASIEYYEQDRDNPRSWRWEVL